MIDQINAFFNELYDETYNATVLYVTLHCADPMQLPDIVQEIYAEVYTSIRKKGTEHIRKPAAFVRHVAKTKLMRYYSFKERIKLLVPLILEDEDGGEHEHEGIEPDNMRVEDRVESRLTMERIMRHIETKPTDVQRIFTLYYYLELPIGRISAELNMNESTVKSKLYRTVHEIRKLYGEDERSYDGKGII